MSCAGLTRASITLREKHFSKQMDGPVKPGHDGLMSSLRIGILDIRIRPLKFAGAAQVDGIAERARRIAGLLLKSLVFVERFMRRRVRLHVADVTVYLGGPAGLDQRHIGEPIR